MPNEDATVPCGAAGLRLAPAGGFYQPCEQITDRMTTKGEATAITAGGRPRRRGPYFEVITQMPSQLSGGSAFRCSQRSV